jgi:hypothetical protein
MKNQIINYLKPTLGKIILMIGFLGWQYEYSHLGLRADFLNQYGEYFGRTLSIVDWNNYFIRNLSLFFVWIIVALLIFVGIWVFQSISIALYNHNIKKNYLNQPEKDYQHLLKNRSNFTHHLKSKLFWFAGIMIILISLFALSDLFEQLRFTTLDSIVWNAFENGTTIDMYSLPLTIGSFVVMGIMWYFVSAFIVWLFVEQKSKEQEEDISEQHFAVSVDTNTPSDQEED